MSLNQEYLVDIIFIFGEVSRNLLYGVYGEFSTESFKNRKFEKLCAKGYSIQ